MDSGIEVDFKYRVVRPLGKGGQGSVYLAEQDFGFGKKLVAIKIIHRLSAVEAAKQAMLKSMLMREAEALHRIRHECVVGFEGLQLDPDQNVLLFMEYIPGKNLSDILDSRGPVSVREAVLATRALLGGLDAIHDQGMVHRDLSPANILCRDDDITRPVLIDFGLTKFVDADTILEGRAAGTFSVMSPEQFTDPDNVSRRSDYYALGLLLYRMITGRKAFTASTLEGHVQARRRVPDLGPVPPVLHAVLDHLLQPNPMDRPENSESIRQLLDGAVDVAQTSLADTAVPVRKANPLVAAGLALAVLLPLNAAFAWLVWERTSPPQGARQQAASLDRAAVEDIAQQVLTPALEGALATAEERLAAASASPDPEALAALAREALAPALSSLETRLSSQIPSMIQIRREAADIAGAVTDRLRQELQSQQPRPTAAGSPTVDAVAALTQGQDQLEAMVQALQADLQAQRAQLEAQRTAPEAIPTPAGATLADLALVADLATRMDSMGEQVAALQAQVTALTRGDRNGTVTQQDLSALRERLSTTQTEIETIKEAVAQTVSAAARQTRGLPGLIDSRLTQTLEPQLAGLVQDLSGLRARLADLEAAMSSRPPGVAPSPQPAPTVRRSTLPNASVSARAIQGLDQALEELSQVQFSDPLLYHSDPLDRLYAGVGRLFGDAIFVQGPHKATTLDRTQIQDFGHYNPAFARWLERLVIAAMDDPDQQQALRRMYQQAPYKQLLISLHMSHRLLRVNLRHQQALRAFFQAYKEGAATCFGLNRANCYPNIVHALQCQAQAQHLYYTGQCERMMDEPMGQAYAEVLQRSDTRALLASLAPVFTTEPALQAFEHPDEMVGYVLSFWVRRLDDGTFAVFGRVVDQALKGADPSLHSGLERRHGRWQLPTP